ADHTGAWTFDYSQTSLADGTHSFTARATDLAGNQSDLSSAFVVTVDTQIATPSILTISTDSGASDSDRVTNDATLVLTGSAEANSRVALFHNDQLIDTIQADHTGAWTFDYSQTSLTDGT